MTDWSDEQLLILAHDIGQDGRILAGPGTGKSTTILALGEALQESEDTSGAVQVITFTRAATAELTLKSIEGDHAFAPRTLHSHALSLLMSNPGISGLPEPLRIPDDWEAKKLLQPDLAERLRERGFDGTGVREVRRLLVEMASQWESLGSEPLMADLNPDLRNAFLAVWGGHRTVFGYSLFAEMPLYAKQIIEDHGDLNLGGLRFLIVDEYQDLNRCEIGMLEALSTTGVQIMAVGDDDQSIYGFRMADPSGIVEFQTFFPEAADYSMSVSHRCGKSVLDAARVLIESAPTRATKPALKPGDNNPDGEFAYLRFRNQRAESQGVAALVEHLIDHHGLDPTEIVIMMRADNNNQWSRPLRQALQDRGIDSADVEQALAPLAERESRLAVAIARLAVNRNDDIAWWAFLDQTPGISPEFVRRIADEALANGERFAVRLLRINEDPPDGVTPTSLNAATGLLHEIAESLENLDTQGVEASEFGWAEWLIDTCHDLGIAVSEEFSGLLKSVGIVTPQGEGLGHFLNQLEPVTKDQALQTEGVSIMSMSRSKGLTRRAAIVVGVETGVVPYPRNDDVEEERRLLYVAMTRPREFLYLTMARRRGGPQAFTGAPNLMPRSRSSFFRNTPISPIDGPRYLAEIT